MDKTGKSSMAKVWADCPLRRTSVRAMILVTLVALSSTGEAFAQAAALTITKSFNPSTVAVGGDSTLTVTVTNPNAVPVTAVQFSDTMPAGIDLITQTGGTCSTLATGGGIFSINPGAETFSSTSNVLAPGQSCSITLLVGQPRSAHTSTRRRKSPAPEFPLVAPRRQP
jgi:uncharacterized repeat protein (TIGR01451 family)